MKGHKIITEHVYPPIPDRSCDWSAVLEGYDGGDVAPGVPSRDPIGRGPTELAAIADLLDQAEAWFTGESPGERDARDARERIAEIGSKPGPICNNYREDRHREGFCANCEHSAARHSSRVGDSDE